MDGTGGEATAAGWIGAGLARREDARLLTGRGRFVADLVPPGALRLVFVRTPEGPGRIVGLDVAAARAAPGVRLVLTAADLADLGTAPVNPLLPGAALRPMVPLARDRVGAAGQAVAAVVAETEAGARDAAEAVQLVLAAEAEAAETVVAHRIGGSGLPPTGGRVVARIVHDRVAPCALEPRAALAEARDGRLTVWLSTQTPQRCREALAAILGLAPEAVRVIAPDVGGAFGGKASLMPEDVVVAAAALRLDAPVAWVASRSEEFLAATQGRGILLEGCLATGPDGAPVALSARIAAPLGHWMPYSALVPLRNAARILPGPYAVPEVTVEAEARAGATAAVNIYRGAGRPEAAILMERLIDRAAAAAGLDPLEARRRWARPASAFPAATGAGDPVCSADLPGLLDRLAAVSGYPARRAALSARRARGETAGLGLALYLEPCGQGWEAAEARLMADGRVEIATGASAQGQGRETAVAQIAAAALGCDPGAVTVLQGDTAAVPEGIGALASRATAIGGSAVLLAARALAGELRAAAAPLLNAAPDTVLLGPAGAAAPHGARLDWAELAARIAPPGAAVARAAPVRYTAPAEAWASGAVLAEVAIDRETGAVAVMRLDWVDDPGTVVNPVLVEGQLVGGAAQGLGAALMERIVYDAAGQLLTGSFMDYALPRAADMPPLRLAGRPTPTPANALGARGVGEAGCIGVPAAILNAVMDALPPGTPDLPLPLTPERVWRALTGGDRC